MIEELPKLKGRPIEFADEPPESIFMDSADKIESSIRVVGVRFNDVGRVFDFNAGSLELKVEDAVIVDVAEKGLMFARVCDLPMQVSCEKLKSRLRHVVRKATSEDLNRYQNQQRNEKMGLERTQRAVNKLNLPMEILRVEYTLDLRNAVVYFAAENRVDFRELLKELIHDLKARVELRQVGVRDQTAMDGCIGPCGEETCCSRFINKFHGVSIKMAKDQELSLKPSKVGGMCGRLKCCLAYEHQCYREALQHVPKRGRSVMYGDKKGVVQDIDILRRRVTILTEEGSVITVSASEVRDATGPVSPELKQQIAKHLDYAPGYDDDDENVVLEDD